MFKIRIRIPVVRVWCVLLCMLACCAIAVPSQPDEPELSPAIVEARADFLKTKRGSERGEAARRLFTDRSPQEILMLSFDDDNSVALCAAWHRLQLQMQANLLGKDRGANSVRIEDALAREFLGFIEGRLQVPVPDHWAGGLKLGHALSKGGTKFFDLLPVDSVRLPIEKPLDEQSRIALPQAKTIAGVYYFQGNAPYEGKIDTHGIPEEISALLLQAKSIEAVITGLAVEDRGVIILPGNEVREPEAVCLGVDDQKSVVLWRYDLDARWDGKPRSPTKSYTELRYRRGMLFLFHLAEDAIGIECLKMEDGTRVFSFNTILP